MQYFLQFAIFLKMFKFYVLWGNDYIAINTVNQILMTGRKRVRCRTIYYYWYQNNSRVFSLWIRIYRILLGVINHWRMNWDPLNVFLCCLCLCGTLLALLTLEQEVVSSNTTFYKFYSTESHQEKTRLWMKMVLLLFLYFIVL